MKYIKFQDFFPNIIFNLEPNPIMFYKLEEYYLGFNILGFET